jgi:purine-binding chemotaxis protein CheW
MNAPAKTTSKNALGFPLGGKLLTDEDQRDFVSVTIAGQLFGIPVLQVQDVLGTQQITRIPLAPPEVAGSLNLRGRIVTAIDIRIRLRLPRREAGEVPMSVVVDQGGELYSLLVDSVGEVLSLSSKIYERNPATLDPAWRDVSAGIFRLDGTLLIVLDVGRLLDFSSRPDAA